MLSFGGDDDTERHIAVKTTTLGKHAPFHVSACEVAHSEKMDDRYFIYRFFDATRRPRAYARQGPLKQVFRLEATSFVCAH